MRHKHDGFYYYTFSLKVNIENCVHIMKLVACMTRS